MKTSGRLQTHRHLGARDYRYRSTIECLRSQEEAGVSLFGKLRHLRTAMYMGGKIKSIHTGSDKMNAHKRPKKDLLLLLWDDPRLSNLLISEGLLSWSAKTRRSGCFFKCPVFNKRSEDI